MRPSASLTEVGLSAAPRMSRAFDRHFEEGVYWPASGKREISASLPDTMSTETLARMLKRELALHPDAAAAIVTQLAVAAGAADTLLGSESGLESILLEKKSDGSLRVTVATPDGEGSGSGEASSSGSVGAPSLARLAVVALSGEMTFLALPARAADQARIVTEFTGRASSANGVVDRIALIADFAERLSWPGPLVELFSDALGDDLRAPSETEALRFAESFHALVSELTPSQSAAMYRRALERQLANISVFPVDDEETQDDSSGAVDADVKEGATAKGSARDANLEGAATRDEASWNEASASASQVIDSVEAGDATEGAAETTETQEASFSEAPKPTGAAPSAARVDADGARQDDKGDAEDAGSGEQSAVGAGLLRIIRDAAYDVVDELANAGTVAVTILSLSFVAGLIAWATLYVDGGGASVGESPPEISVTSVPAAVSGEKTPAPGDSLRATVRHAPGKGDSAATDEVAGDAPG